MTGRLAGVVAVAATLAALTGCVVSDQPPANVVYEDAPAPAPQPQYAAPSPQGGEEIVYDDSAAPNDGVVITADSDFYGPLEPYGEWVEVDGYGRCWRPRNVERDWRPYTNGHWRRTDSGWYWESEESWGWATCHYGRWNEDSRNGWYWVPDTHWAPAWVSWREGGGYTGWAPLPPPRRRDGINVNVNVEVAPRSFVYVEDRHFSERVRPTTVIVNNTTIINKTVNINQTRITNNTVINGGPRTEVIERASGRKVDVTHVRDVRRTEEKKIVVKPQPTSAPRQPPPAPNQPKAPVRRDRPADNTQPPSYAGRQGQPPPQPQPQPKPQPAPTPHPETVAQPVPPVHRDPPPPPAERRETPPAQLITGPRGTQPANVATPPNETATKPAPRPELERKDLPKKLPPKKVPQEKAQPPKDKPDAPKDKPEEQKEKAQQ